MRAPVSVIVPTLNEAAELPFCLVALGEGLQAGLLREVIVSDGGSTDATRAIAEAAGALVIGPAAGPSPKTFPLVPRGPESPDTGAAPSPLGGEGWGEGALDMPAGRGGQLRRGAGAAGGTWLMFLHADTRLQPGWAAAVLDHISESADAAWFRLTFRCEPGAGAPSPHPSPPRGEGVAPMSRSGHVGGERPGAGVGAIASIPRMARLVAGWANLRSRAGLPYGDQGLLVPRALYDSVGGYPDWPLMEDVALARRLRGRLRGLPAVAETSAEAYLTNGWVRQGGGNLWRLVRYLAGADPALLARGYGRGRSK